MKAANGEKRSFDQLREHYEIEKKLAAKLRHSGAAERKALYNSVYDELFTTVRHHPQLIRKASEDEKQAAVSQQMALLKGFLRPSTRFLEIGAGSCHLSLTVSRMVKCAYAVDVSEEITKNLKRHNNFQFLLSDGCSIPVPPGSIETAYSFQLIEHLHPNDAHEQLLNIYKALGDGGVYICITNNRVTGPHDISKYFDEAATGLHLKEYSSTELKDLFLKCGFQDIKFYLGIKRNYFEVPAFLIRMCEDIANCVPRRIRKRVIGGGPLRRIIDLLIVVGRKQFI